MRAISIRIAARLIVRYDLAAGHIPNTALPRKTGIVGRCGAPRKDVSQLERCAARRADNADHARPRVRLPSRLIPNRPARGCVLDPSPDETTMTLVTRYRVYFVGHAQK